ncbi:MAG: glycosyltransferase family 39 protein [Deltaproteobacteria bacterium]|nr:glycosyltransferase family 39 protein [Deltaproteobacteria bacterium]
MAPRIARDVLHYGAVVGLLALSVLQPILSLRQKTVTGDEVAHIPAGYAYLTTGEFRLNPEHPPLIKLLAAVPLLFLPLKPPPLPPGHPDQVQWQWGQQFLFTQDADRILFWARLPITLLSGTLAWLVYAWAAALWGRPGGLVALGLYAFEPNLLAHARLVTMDLGIALFFFAATWAWWRVFQRPSGGRLVLTGLAAGLLLATKFAGAVWLLVAPALAALARALPATGTDDLHAWQQLPWRRVLAMTAVVLELALGLLYATYLFPRDPWVIWRGFLWSQSKLINPHFEIFLLGSYRPFGWWYYPLVAFVLKTPVPALLLVTAGALALWRHRPARLAALPLAQPPLILLLVVCWRAPNLGLRYLLTVYPFLYVLAGAAWALRPAGPRRWLGTAVVLALLAWHASEALRIAPDYLPYFNQLAGGPERGVESLDDSNVDWGEDLNRLKPYLVGRGIPQVYLAYPWPAPPEYYGIQAELPTVDDLRSPRPGVYVISAHAYSRLRLLYQRDPQLRGARNWLAETRPVARIGHSLFGYDLRGRP